MTWQGSLRFLHSCATGRVWPANIVGCQKPNLIFHLQLTNIVARQHGGSTIESNLALACPCCNLHKGPNIAGIDPESGSLCVLFHPRQHRWTDHFRWEGVVIIPITPIGRTTVIVLAMNDPRQIAVRQTMLASGWLLQSP